jgi:hypothetical protein
VNKEPFGLWLTQRNELQLSRLSHVLDLKPEEERILGWRPEEEEGGPPH